MIYEIAHRFGDELLLWDGWGRITGPGTEVTEEDAVWLDGVAALLVAADDGDLDAEAARAVALPVRRRAPPRADHRAGVAVRRPTGRGHARAKLTARE